MSVIGMGGMAQQPNRSILPAADGKNKKKANTTGKQQTAEVKTSSRNQTSRVCISVEAFKRARV